jgi:hypothetical protein
MTPFPAFAAAQRMIRPRAIRAPTAMVNQPERISENRLAPLARNLTSGCIASSCSDVS